jgi:hypothetical protein
VLQTVWLDLLALSKSHAFNALMRVNGFIFLVSDGKQQAPSALVSHSLSGLAPPGWHDLNRRFCWPFWPTFSSN